MDLIDAHDANERTFLASLQGVDLTKSHKPGRQSSQTAVGFDSFYRANWDTISQAGG